MKNTVDCRRENINTLLSMLADWVEDNEEDQSIGLYCSRENGVITASIVDFKSKKYSTLFTRGDNN